MATWASVLDLSGNSHTSDGKLIYFIDSSAPGTNIDFYDPSTGTTTTIGSRTDVGFPIAWFKNRLFARLMTAGSSIIPSGDTTIYRWEGGTSWSIVDQRTSTDILNELNPNGWTRVDIESVGISTITYSKDFLISVIPFSLTGGGADKAYIRYSQDGITWNTGTWSSGLAISAPGYAGATQTARSISPVITANDGVNDETYRWDQTLFTRVTGNLAAGRAFYGCFGGKYWRRDGPVTYTGNQHSTDLSGWTSPSDGAITANAYSDLAYNQEEKSSPIGWKKTGAGHFMHTWDGSDWNVASEQVNAILAQTGLSFLRLDDGNIYAENSSAPNSFWSIRSEPLGGLPDTEEHEEYDKAKFMYGRDQLIVRGDWNVPGVGPGAMLLAGKIVVAGADSSGATTKVEYDNASPYDNPTDFTGNHPASVINSLDGTPFGNADDNQDSDSDSGPGGFPGEKGCN